MAFRAAASLHGGRTFRWQRARHTWQNSLAHASPRRVNAPFQRELGEKPTLPRICARAPPRRCRFAPFSAARRDANEARQTNIAAAGRDSLSCPCAYLLTDHGGRLIGDGRRVRCSIAISPPVFVSSLLRPPLFFLLRGTENEPRSFYRHGSSSSTVGYMHLRSCLARIPEESIRYRENPYREFSRQLRDKLTAMARRRTETYFYFRM